MTTTPHPHVVVLGNHKGGSGKSTLAMHIAVGLMQEGKRVACVDLDFQQRTLTTYIENRRVWTEQHHMLLDIPRCVCVDGFGEDSSFLAGRARISLITSAIATFETDHDVVVIDTPAGCDISNVFAHGLADTVVTPINDSFLDMDVLVKRQNVSHDSMVRPPYIQTIQEAMRARSRVTKKQAEWLVVRNRISPIASRNSREIASALETEAKKVGFRVTGGLSERVIFREFFLCGLTAFDSSEMALLGVKPTMSHVLARLEVRQLLARIACPEPFRFGTSIARNTNSELNHGRGSIKLGEDLLAINSHGAR